MSTCSRCGKESTTGHVCLPMQQPGEAHPVEKINAYMDNLTDEQMGITHEIVEGFVVDENSPDRLYPLKTGSRVTLYSYSENGTRTYEKIFKGGEQMKIEVRCWRG